MPSFEPVRAIIRGLEILRVISESGPINTTDLARRVSLPQPTVVRILETLISAGYVYRMEDYAKYGVTARTLALSSGFDATSRLVQLAEPLVEELRRGIGWPSNLATYEQGAMTVAYTNRSSHGLSIPGLLGARIPVLATGVGMIYLAHLPDAEREAVLTQLKSSKNRWDSSPEMYEDLDARLAEAKKKGHAFANQTYLDEIYHSLIWAVAVPIVVGGRVVGGISSLVLVSSGSKSRMLSQILPPLHRTATAISEALAHDAGTDADL